MAKHAVRLSAAILLVLVFFVADSCQRQRDEAFPGGAAASVTMSFRHSQASREEVVRELTRLGSGEGWIAKVVPDTADFLHGRSLAVFDDDVTRAPIDWYDPAFHGERFPASALGAASLDGVYAVDLDETRTEELVAWARSTGAEASAVRADPGQILGQTVVSAGYGVSVASGAGLLVIAAMSWSAARALRRSMARDLHDVVAQNLAVIALQAEAARYVTDPERGRRLLDTVATLARQTHTDLRGLLDVLYAATADSEADPAPADELAGAGRVDLWEGVRRGTEALERHGFTVIADVPASNGPDVPRSVQSTLYRVLQEAVANVVKHAPAGSGVRVAVAADRDAVVLEVHNEMPAAGAAQEGVGYGLLNISERVALLGGDADVGPHEGRWRVRAKVPRRD